MSESDGRWPNGARRRQQLRRGRQPAQEPHDRTAHHAKDGKNTIEDEQTAAAGRLRAIERVLTLLMRLGWAERMVVRGPQGPPCSSAPG
jgi:hypothetical protein